MLTLLPTPSAVYQQELRQLEQRSRKVKTADDMRRLLNTLNGHPIYARHEISMERAWYLLARGTLFHRAGSQLRSSEWFYSSTETLEYALETLAEASRILKQLLDGGVAPISPIIIEALLEQVVDEAAVAYTTLNMWRYAPPEELKPDFSRLRGRRHRCAELALKHGWAMSQRK